MATAQTSFRKARSVVPLGIVFGMMLTGCFVYSEELLDSDVVSLGEGDQTSTPAQRKLESVPNGVPKPPAQTGLGLRGVAAPERLDWSQDGADAGVISMP